MTFAHSPLTQVHILSLSWLLVGTNLPLSLSFSAFLQDARESVNHFHLLWQRLAQTQINAGLSGLSFSPYSCLSLSWCLMFSGLRSLCSLVFKRVLASLYEGLSFRLSARLSFPSIRHVRKSLQIALDVFNQVYVPTRAPEFWSYYLGVISLRQCLCWQCILHFTVVFAGLSNLLSLFSGTWV